MGQSFTSNLHCVNYKQSHCIIQPQGAVFRGWLSHLWVAGWGKGQSLVVVWLGAFSVVTLESGLLDYDGKSLQWWEQLYASSIYRFGEFVFFVFVGVFCFVLRSYFICEYSEYTRYTYLSLHQYSDHPYTFTLVDKHNISMTYTSRIMK